MTTKTKEKWEIVGTVLVNNGGNFCLFLRQSSLSVNNKMSSYRASVEFDFNQESSDSDLSETAEAIVECDPESAIFDF